MNTFERTINRWHTTFGITLCGKPEERRIWIDEYSENVFRSFRWVKVIRPTGLIEAQCQHFVGHPISESVAKLGKSWSIHSCDRCCSESDFPETEAELDHYESTREEIMEEE